MDAGREGRQAGRLSYSGRLALSCVCFALALLSKEMALSFPLIVMAFEVREARRAGQPVGAALRAGAWRFALVWALAAAALALVLTFAATEAPARVPPAWGLLKRLAVFVPIVAHYLWLFVCPWPLRAEYDYAPTYAPAWWLVALCGALLAVLAAVGWRQRRRRPWLWEGGVAFALMLGPVSNVIPILHPMAERYMTLPLTALCYALASGLGAMRSAPRRRAIAAVLIAAWTTLAWVRAAQWRSERTLWESDLKHGNTGDMPLYNLGVYFQHERAYKEAEEYFRKALEVLPDQAKPLNNLGLTLLMQERPAEAEKVLRRTLEVAPNHVRAYLNLADAVYAQGRHDEALAILRESLAARNADVGAWNNLGGYLQRAGEIDEAVQAFRRAVELSPKQAAARRNLGVALTLRGDLDEAIEHLRRAVALEPGLVEAHLGLADALRRQGRTEEALAEIRQASRLDPSAGLYHMLAGDLLVSLGRAPEGRREIQIALELAMRAGDAELAAQARAALGGQP